MKTKKIQKNYLLSPQEKDSVRHLYIDYGRDYNTTWQAFHQQYGHVKEVDFAQFWRTYKNIQLKKEDLIAQDKSLETKVEQTPKRTGTNSEQGVIKSPTRRIVDKTSDPNDYTDFPDNIKSRTSY